MTFDAAAMLDEVAAFTWHEQQTLRTTASIKLGSRSMELPQFVNEFWTSKQRAGHSLHEISYRACFKSQLPRFFIERLTAPGALVYDPFMGRGTTLLEAALLDRRPAGCDINPLSSVLVRPRFEPPTLDEIESRLNELPLASTAEIPQELLVFYHPQTLEHICSLRDYFSAREAAGTLDPVDRWIRMVAINRLTGHSPGFFSVYSMPPNQAVSIKSQQKINERRQQQPPFRDVRQLILKKTRSLLTDCDQTCRGTLAAASSGAQLLAAPADATPELATGSVDLVVTSPPFLDVVDYAVDNWLRCWFCGFDANRVAITRLNNVSEWALAMREVFAELFRVVRQGGFVAFEVGEVRGGTILLEQLVVPAAAAAGFEPILILINQQDFTKTANCWGVDNNKKGTNSNRIVLLQRPGDVLGMQRKLKRK